MAVDQVGWRAICVRFFNDGDPVARGAVGFFDRSQAAAAASAAAHVALAVDTDEAEHAALGLLATVGLENPASLSPGEFLACVQTKNEARTAVHSLVGY